MAGPKRKKKSAKKEGRVQGGRFERKTYMLDLESIQECADIQEGLRATTASETMRYTIRKMYELMAMVGRGAKIFVQLPNKKSPVMFDLPGIFVSRK